MLALGMPAVSLLRGSNRGFPQELPWEIPLGLSIQMGFALKFGASFGATPKMLPWNCKESLKPFDQTAVVCSRPKWPNESVTSD